MEKLTREKDLLNWEEDHPTRISLLSQWFRILLLLMTAFLLYSAFTNIIGISRRIKLIINDMPEGAVFTLLPLIVTLIFKLVLIAAYGGIFLQKKRAAALGASWTIVHVVFLVIGAAGQIFAFSRFDVPFSALLVSALIVLLEIIASIIIIVKLRNIRKQWVSAVPSDTKS